MGSSIGPKMVTDKLVFFLELRNSKSYTNGYTTISNIVPGVNKNITGTRVENNASLSSSNSTDLNSFTGLNFLGNQGDDQGGLLMSSTVNIGSSQNGYFIALILKLPTNQDNGSAWCKFINDYDTPGGLEIGVYGTSNTNFLFKDNTTGGSDNSVAANMGANQYRHLCFGQRADGFAEIYVDGVKKDTSANAWNTSTILDFQELGRGNNNQHFTGNIALMAGYDKELSQAEILQNNRAFNRKIA